MFRIFLGARKALPARLVAGAVAGMLALGVAGAAQAVDRLKIGFLSTLSGPGAALGIEARDAMQLYMKLANSKIGGLPAEMVVADDQTNPDVGKQITERMLKRDKVDIMTGVIFSNVLYAIGNSGLPGLAAHANRLRDDPDPTVAEAAHWAIARLQGTAQ